MVWTTPTAIPDEGIARWLAVRATHPRWASPFFSPEFARAVHRHRPDLQVWIDELDGQPIFWPLHPLPRARFASASMFMCDYQGPTGVTTPAQLALTMRRAGIRLFGFDHVAADMPGFEAWARNRIEAPALDLSGGFAAYQARLAERQGVKVAGVFKSVLGQAKRRMEREIGPVRFVDRDESPAALDALFRWKSAQWQRTVGMQTDRFATPWVRGFVSDLSRSRVADLEGCLSTLYVGDRIVAVHLGLRSGAMMHSWFPAYDIDMATYSPGMYLLLETARAASEKGVTELDLGRGVSPYKSRVMTHSRTVLIGDASSPAWLGHGLRRVHLLRDASRAALRPWWRAAKGLRGRPGVAAASGEDV